MCHEKCQNFDENLNFANNQLMNWESLNAVFIPLKFFDLEKENPFVKDYLRDLYLSLNFKDESEFTKFLESYSNYSIKDINWK